MQEQGEERGIEGERGIEDIGEKRMSKDETVNGEGKELLGWMKSNGLHITNGNMKGRENNNFTYIGGAGSPFIDHIIMNMEARSWAKNMEIRGRIRSLTLRDDNGGKRGEKEKQKEKKRINWGGGEIEKFKREVAKEPLASNWKGMKEKERKAIRWEESRKITKKRKEEDWWDEGCRKRRAEVENCLKEVGDEGKRKKYLKVRRECRKLIVEKKKLRGEKLAEEIGKDRTMKKLWETVNIGKTRGPK